MNIPQVTEIPLRASAVERDDFASDHPAMTAGGSQAASSAPAPVRAASDSKRP
jgi:hypothetical protein